MLKFKNINFEQKIVGTGILSVKVPNAGNELPLLWSKVIVLLQGRTMRWGIAWTFQQNIDLTGVLGTKVRLCTLGLQFVELDVK
jgi:hypothetical protein